MSKKVFLIDSGHGGMIKNVYQTPPRIGKYHRFPSGEVAYEGVVNRLIKKEVLRELTEAGHKAIDICPTELDLSLEMRVDVVNLYCKEYGSENCLFISLHSNAGGGTGFEIYTSPGRSKSDMYATVFNEIFKLYFPFINQRVDYSDGDPDKEAAFYVLVHTRCPAILPEFMFYDNERDWEILKDPASHIRYARMIADFAKRISF